MAKRFKLRELEAQHSNLEALIVPLVNKGGQGEAARVFETTQATISNFLKRKGYIKRIEWVKREDQPA